MTKLAELVAAIAARMDVHFKAEEMQEIGKDAAPEAVLDAFEAAESRTP